MTDHLHPPAPPRDQRKAIELRARDYIRRSAEARRAFKREHRTRTKEAKP